MELRIDCKRPNHFRWRIYVSSQFWWSFRIRMQRDDNILILLTKKLIFSFSFLQSIRNSPVKRFFMSSKWAMHCTWPQLMEVADSRRFYGGGDFGRTGHADSPLNHTSYIISKRWSKKGNERQGGMYRVCFFCVWITCTRFYPLVLRNCFFILWSDAPIAPKASVLPCLVVATHYHAPVWYSIAWALSQEIGLQNPQPELVENWRNNSG